MNTHPNEWQLQDAKNKLSHLVKQANKGVPQYIMIHERSTAVVISAQEYERLRRPNPSLSSALLMPLLDDNESNIFERNTDAD